MKVDKRFSEIAKDARFKTMPRRERKVKIDSRFKSMFTDKKFKTKYYVDKRGRPEMKSTKEDLKRFYEMDEDEVDDSSQKIGTKELSLQDKKNINQTVSKASKRQSVNKILENIEDDDNSDSDEDIDFSDIRGGVQSSSSDEEESQDEDEDIQHDWGELDHDALRKEEDVVTSRLAACNLDWDRVNANDLFVLFSSFGGTIKTVKIYLSEFGKKRLAEEDLNGPSELKSESENEAEENTDDVDPNNLEGSQFHLEKLRKYQLNRMKYYYAVIECDSKETANNIYEECDGMEYEMSATRLDLRFIPDDTDFEDEPKDTATGRPLLENYQPTRFCNTALQQSTVRCTWDEPDQKRMAVTMRKFNKDEILDMDFKAYLASSDDDDDDADGQSLDKSSDAQDNDQTNKKDSEDTNINKYRALLQEIEAQEQNDDDEQHMEISWATGLSETAEKIVKNKKEQEEEKSLTPWEKYLKDKKKKRKEKNKSDRHDQIETELTENQTENDHSNDIGEGFNDPFFTESLNHEEKKVLENEKKKRKRLKRNENENDKDDKEKNELELLLMDDTEDKQHFNLKSIMANEKRKKKQRKHGKKQAQETTEDNFEIDVKDARFDALFTSHMYAPDPSDPQFKKTKAMDKILEEQQRRRKDGPSKSRMNVTEMRTNGKSLDPSLSALVKSVKSRTEQFHNRKKTKLS